MARLGRGATIADYLQLRHHSAVGLIDRADAAGLVRRASDPHDRRLAHVQLRAKGARVLEQLIALHVSELRSLASGTLLPDLPVELDDGTEVDDAAGRRGAITTPWRPTCPRLRARRSPTAPRPGAEARGHAPARKKEPTSTARTYSVTMAMGGSFS